MHTTAARVSGPIGNRLAVAVLRSPVHRLLSGSMLILQVRGRRTGRVHTFPVRYARDGDRLVVLPGHAERKVWWRNLTGGATVGIRLTGEARRAYGEALRVGDPDFRSAAQLYGERYRLSAHAAAGSPVLVQLTLAR